MAGSFIRVENQDFDGLIKKLKQVENKALPLTMDKVTSTIAAEGRRDSSMTTMSKLKMGQVQYKSTASGEHVGGTEYSSKAGTFIARARAGFRVENFSFENAAYSRRRARISTFSNVKATSQIQNLWSKPTKAYKSKSPFFHREGEKAKRIGENQRREQRTDWSAFEASIAKGVPQGIARANVWLQDQLNKGGLV
ncbi:MAG: hypothetical protein ACI4NM_10170 [Bullifex sp.]